LAGALLLELLSGAGGGDTGCGAERVKLEVPSKLRTGAGGAARYWFVDVMLFTAGAGGVYPRVGTGS
jgi:hypothetical protein